MGICFEGYGGIETDLRKPTEEGVELRDSLAEFGRYWTNTLLEIESRSNDVTHLTSRRSPIAMNRGSGEWTPLLVLEKELSSKICALNLVLSH